MISKFWDALFDYADKAKAENDMVRYGIIHDVEDLLQEAYDRGMEGKKMVRDYQPKSGIPKMVSMIPDIEIYKDTQDGTMFYELDGKHFDYPEEVIKYLIDFRSGEAVKEMARYRARFLEAVKDSIDEFTLGNALEGKQRMIREVTHE